MANSQTLLSFIGFFHQHGTSLVPNGLRLKDCMPAPTYSTQRDIIFHFAKEAGTGTNFQAQWLVPGILISDPNSQQLNSLVMKTELVFHSSMSSQAKIDYLFKSTT